MQENKLLVHMKYNIIIMLLFVLCLFGCSSEEDPQSVAFCIDEYDIDWFGGDIRLDITANCKWTVTATGEGLSILIKEGEGNSYTKAQVSMNTGYDMRFSFITVTSEDGSSSSIVRVNQERTYALTVDQQETSLSATGGEFSIPVSTNEPEVSFSLPDWITHTGSRGLDKYTYTFKAEPNKTGEPRNGSVVINGLESHSSHIVKQDSFDPDSVKLLQDISWTTNRDLSIPVSITPEYADISKITIEENNNINKASIKDGKLNVELSNYGPFEILLKAGHKEIGRYKGEFLSKNPLSIGSNREIYIGQKLYIDYNYYSADYILTSSDNNVLEVLDNTKVLAKNLGESTLIAEHPYVDSKSEVTIKVEPFLLNARIGWIGEQWDGTFNVWFTAMITGPNNMTNMQFSVSDKTGRSIISNEGSIDNRGVITTKIINVNRNGYYNILDVLTEYVFKVSVSINGNKYSKSANISNSVGSY